MTKEQYIKITEPLRNNQERANRVTSLNHVLTALVFCVYPLYLFMLFADKDPWLWRAILVPAVSFVGLSIVRKIINAPRPYEKFDMPPVLEKDTKGKAFPSRHVFSVFIIAMTIFYEHPGAGVMLGIIGLLLGIVRVLVGVHEPKDIAAGRAGRDRVRNCWLLYDRMISVMAVHSASGIPSGSAGSVF